MPQTLAAVKSGAAQMRGVNLGSWLVLEGWMVCPRPPHRLLQPSHCLPSLVVCSFVATRRLVVKAEDPLHRLL